MATRRTGKSDTAGPSKDDADVSPVATSTAVAVPGSVVAKLLLFTLAMVTVPLSTYYISVTSVFVGNSTAAGAFAAVAANVVLIAYVIVAMNEDDTDYGDKKTQ